MTVHLVPIDDLKEHVDSESCWCGPEELDEDCDEVVFLHRSMDGREGDLSGERKLQ